MRQRATVWLAQGCLLCTTACFGADLQWQAGDFTATFSGRFTIGAAWRMEQRDVDLLGKLNVPGQQGLCIEDDCMSTSGDPAPNQRLVDARGSFGGANGDDGNLNYDQYDLIAAVAQLSPELTFEWGPVFAKVNGIGYFDPVNADFDETHTDTRFQPAQTPRSDQVEEEFARGFKLREAYVSTELPIGETPWVLSVGSQVIRWGEANLTLFNTLNEISPPDGTIVRMPGFQLKEAYQAVPAVVLAGSLGSAWSFEALYQLQWVGVVPDPAGSFFSTNDYIGGGDYLMTGLGQFSEDPDRLYTPPGLSGLLTSSSRTIYPMPDSYGEPRDAGQYGLQLKYFAESLNGGTELGFYYLRYHSRLPYISIIAADASCTRDSATNTFAEVLLVCQGFNGSINPVGLEPLPTDTERPFLDYPEDIDMIGVSFNTNAGDWSLSGEYAFRPNMPLQVHGTDVLFASIAPAFPEEDIEVPLEGAALFTLPGHRRAAPDFVSLYRGLDEYKAGQTVVGYERFKVGQFVLGGLRSLGAENPIGADQVIIAAEAGLTHIVDLPPLSALQLEGHGDRIHYSPGADGTGDPNGEIDTLRVNPTQQTQGFVTDWSWGYRLLVRASYTNVFGALTVHPTLVFFHDVYGISPAQIDNYVEGRMFIVPALDVDFGQSVTTGLQYQIYTGAEPLNRRSDRDNLAAYVRVTF